MASVPYSCKSANKLATVPCREPMSADTGHNSHFTLGWKFSVFSPR